MITPPDPNKQAPPIPAAGATTTHAPAKPAQTVLYFGRHKGQPLSAIPADYLAWCLRTVKLSGGIRQAIADELTRRGVVVPQTPPRPAPTCRTCPGATVLARWMEARDGSRRIRGECAQCHRSCGFLPQVEPYRSEADRAAVPAPILDALTRLEEIGVELQSDGRAGWFGADWRRVPPDLAATVRQCSHQLARMLGDTRRKAAAARRWEG
jgi:hypothetical protein